MKIGFSQLFEQNFPAKIMCRLRLNAARIGGEAALNSFLLTGDETRSVLKGGLKRLYKLRAGRSRGNAWCRAETLRMFRSRNFQTAVALIQAAIKDDYLSLPEARHFADCARDLSTDEAVTIEPREKASGGERIIVKHGPINSIRNRALALMVEAASGPFEFEYCQLGKGGVEAAAKHIGEGVLQDCRFWITCDLTNAYPSVKLDHVNKLIPVHGQLMRAVGFPSHSYKKITNEDGVRPGLTEGASHSSKILSAFTDGPLRKISGSIMVLCYADNIALGARTLDEVKCAFKTFENAMSASKADPIHLHSVNICDAFQHHGHVKKGHLTERNGIDFCQYRISYDIFDGKLRYRANTLAFYKAKKNAFARLSGVTVEDEMEAIVDAYLDNWLRSFRLWKVNDNTLECLKQTRDQWIYEFKYGKTADAA